MEIGGGGVWGQLKAAMTMGAPMELGRRRAAMGCVTHGNRVCKPREYNREWF